MDQPTVEALATRLNKLERENRRTKWLGCFLVVGVAAVAVTLINPNTTALLFFEESNH
jgi:hypothetical protein